MDTPTFTALVLKTEGRFSAHAGDIEAARQGFRKAAEVCHDLEWLIEEAMVLEELGEVESRSGSSDLARAPLAQALELFEGMGARVRAERVRKRLQSLA
jgi:Flp pilus assembly protein TadD